MNNKKKLNNKRPDNNSYLTDISKTYYKMATQTNKSPSNSINIMNNFSDNTGKIHKQTL